MAKKTEQVVTLRVPKGLPDEIRAVTGLAFSTVLRHLAITFLNAEKAKLARKAEEQDNVG